MTRITSHGRDLAAYGFVTVGYGCVRFSWSATLQGLSDGEGKDRGALHRKCPRHRVQPLRGIPPRQVLDAGGYGDLDADTVRTMLDEVARLAEGPVAASFVDADRHPPVFDPDSPHHQRAGELAKSVQTVKTRTGGGSASPRRSAASPPPLRWHGAWSEMLLCANSSAGFLVGARPDDGQRALRRGQRAAKALGSKGSGTRLDGHHGVDRARRGLRCRRRPRKGDRPAGRHLAYRRGEAVHLGRRRRRHRGEHLPPGAGTARGCRPRHQGTQPVLRAELSLRSRNTRTRLSQWSFRDRT